MCSGITGENVSHLVYIKRRIPVCLSHISGTVHPVCLFQVDRHSAIAAHTVVENVIASVLFIVNDLKIYEVIRELLCSVGLYVIELYSLIKLQAAILQVKQSAISQQVCPEGALNLYG